MERNWTVLDIKAAHLHRQFPEWRAGQCYFNALAEYDPETAGKIRGTPFDCFHNNEKISSFEKKVIELWGEESRET